MTLIGDWRRGALHLSYVCVLILLLMLLDEHHAQPTKLQLLLIGGAVAGWMLSLSPRESRK